MKMNIKIIDEIVDINNDNADIEVTISDNKYVATFFTLKNISTLFESYRNTGECLAGSYFWSSNMIIVKDLNEETIQSVISQLVESDEFEDVFEKIID